MTAGKARAIWLLTLPTPNVGLLYEFRKTNSEENAWGFFG